MGPGSLAARSPGSFRQLGVKEVRRGGELGAQGQDVCTYRRGCDPAGCPARCRRAGSAGGSRCGSKAAAGAGCRAGAPAPRNPARRLGRPSPASPVSRLAAVAAPLQEAVGSVTPPAGPSPPGRPRRLRLLLREPWRGCTGRLKFRKTREPQYKV